MSITWGVPLKGTIKADIGILGIGVDIDRWISIQMWQFLLMVVPLTGLRAPSKGFRVDVGQVKS